SLRKARFEHVHAQRFEHLRHAQPGAPVHREAGRLLAVAQGGVEDPHAISDCVVVAGRVVLLAGVFHHGSAVWASPNAQKSPASVTGCGVLWVFSGFSSYLDTCPQPAPPLVIRSTSTRVIMSVPRACSRPSTVA